MPKGDERTPLKGIQLSNECLSLVIECRKISKTWENESKSVRAVHRRATDPASVAVKATWPESHMINVMSFPR